MNNQDLILYNYLKKLCDQDFHIYCQNNLKNILTFYSSFSFLYPTFCVIYEYDPSFLPSPGFNELSRPGIFI